MRVTRILAILSAATLISSVSLIAPSQAATLQGRNWVAAPNGLVGVKQTIIVKASRSRGEVATVTFQNASSGTNAGQAIVNQQGFAYLPWTPANTGSWTIGATVGGVSIGTASITVAAMPTSTVLLTPGEVAENQTARLVAEVKALGGSVTPSGTVTIRNQFGNTVATGNVAPSSIVGLATIGLDWTPSAGSVTLTADFSPATSAFTSSTSPAQSPTVAGQQAVSLQLPPISYVGVEETISAVIQPLYQSPLGGSVGFSLNIDGFLFYPMGGSEPIAGGIGSASWTPTQPGIQTVGVSYASADFAINGSDTQVINVRPAPEADEITVTPTGSSPWSPGTAVTLPQGSVTEFTPTSQSSNPVTLTTDGPCALDAAQLNALGPGQCEITATSLGNDGSLSPTTSTYTVTITAPPKKSKKKQK